MIRFLALFLFVCASASCAKVSYVVKQGVGQVSLEWKGRKNEKVLADETVSAEHKEKIKKIMEYKKFFYSYFDRKNTGIYNQTTFLDDSAVSYLVIASPPDKIEAVEHSFPIVGTFPYLGFFNRKDAQRFQRELQDKGLDTWLRPVYAYSTLGQWIFDDNILSSFFVYSELELAELVFHELFHTIYFVKNEVALNENLAQYFSRELVFEYFEYSELERERYIQEKAKEIRLIERIVALANQLKEKYAEEASSPDQARQARKEFMDDVFKPEMGLACEEMAIKDCWPLDKEWNNARFAEFLTYEAGQNQIERLKQKNSPDLRTFLSYLEKERKAFEKGDGKSKQEESFEEYLFRDLEQDA